MIAGLILAGGRSRRMGGADKAFCRLDGESLLARAVRRLAPQVGAIAIAAGRDPGRFAAFGLPTLVDGEGDAGPLAGVLAGLVWAEALLPRPDHLVTVPVDAPFFPDDLARRLTAAGNDGLAVAVGTGGRQPTFCAFTLGLAVPLRAFLSGGGRRVGEFLEECDAREVSFASDGRDDPFLNVNTPDALARLGGTADPTDT